ncbi:hypothetical protein ACHAWF_015507 [Thalassiosira exigua]
MTMTMEGYERYHQFVDRLTENNVDEYIDLPMIAVMGDTSSGKSSLLSNISLVELPSADVITTRCPIMLKMHHDSVRSACVKISWKDKPDVADAEFAERKIEEENWSSITSAIADAQAHIIKMSGKDVARDIVSVDMRGPHCENLTLIDLPGIVRATGRGESASLAEDIQSLMSDFLTNPRCVILAVLPCNVDFHNSQIIAEARKVDRLTKRTIPVLTKPDLIDHGGERSVKDLLLGAKTDSFDMGFHMVKGRGQAALDRNQSIEEGLQDEDNFFTNTEPWRSIDNKNLFSTKNLRVKLAALQMDLIQSSFKDIVSDLKSQREEALTDIQALGHVPANLADKRTLFYSIKKEILNTINTKTLYGHIHYIDVHSEMRPSAKFHVASKLFQDSLNSSKLANISDISIGTKVIAVHNGKDFRGEICYVSDNIVYLKEYVRNGATCTRVGDNDGEVKITQQGSRVYKQLSSGMKQELFLFERKLVHPDPKWISDYIEHYRPYKLPIFINTELFEAIVADLIKKDWAPPAMKLLDYTSEFMNSAAEDFIKDLNQTKPFPLLQTYLTNRSAEVVEFLTQEKQIHLREYVARDQVPYSQNHYLFENVCKLKTQRLMEEVLAALPVGTSVQINPSSLASTIKNVFQRNQNKSVDDHMAEEMMHAIDGYGKVALKRFIDDVPMICIEIMQMFADKLDEILSKTTDDELEHIIKASFNTVAKLNQLKQKAERLGKGIDALVCELVIALIINELYPFQRKLVRSDPQWISECIKHFHPNKLPVFINTDLFEAIVANLIKKDCAPPAMEFFDYTSTLMKDAARGFIEELKQTWSFPSFPSFLVNKSTEVVEDLTQGKRIQLEDDVTQELTPYTKNHYLFENVCKLKSQRGDSFIEIKPSDLALTVKGVFQRNQERSVYDHMAEDMLHVLSGYGKVALKIFIDKVRTYDMH